MADWDAFGTKGTFVGGVGLVYNRFLMAWQFSGIPMWEDFSLSIIPCEAQLCRGGGKGLGLPSVFVCVCVCVWECEKLPEVRLCPLFLDIRYGSGGV